jgi:hypothetical protein
MAGHSHFWNYLLDASLGYREERPCFHSNVHSITTCYNSRHFYALVERKPLLEKVIKVFFFFFDMFAQEGEGGIRTSNLRFIKRGPSRFSYLLGTR